MRRICSIRRFGAKLEAHLLPDGEPAKHTQIEIHRARTTQDIASRASEPHANRRRKRGRIEKRLSRPNPSEFLDYRLNLIGRLSIARSIERTGRSRYGERTS